MGPPYPRAQLAVYTTYRLEAPLLSLHKIVRRIEAMNVPVDDWDAMKEEMLTGYDEMLP